MSEKKTHFNGCTGLVAFPIISKQNLAMKSEEEPFDKN